MGKSGGILLLDGKKFFFKLEISRQILTKNCLSLRNKPYTAKLCF